jgi:hypothetical protein
MTDAELVDESIKFLKTIESLAGKVEASIYIRNGKPVPCITWTHDTLKGVCERLVAVEQEFRRTGLLRTGQ